MSRISKQKRREKRQKKLRAHILTDVIVCGSIILGLTAILCLLLWWNQPLTEENTVEITSTVRSVERERRYRRVWYKVYMTLSDGEVYEKSQSFFVGEDLYFSSYEEMEAALEGKSVTITAFDSMYASQIMALRLGDEEILTLDVSNEHRREGRVMWGMIYGFAVLLTVGCGVLFCIEGAEKKHLLVPSEKRRRARDKRERRKKARHAKQAKDTQPPHPEEDETS